MALFIALSAAAAGAADEPKRKPWDGSSLSLRNSTSAISLDRGAQLTYDPLYSMTLGFDPRWQFTERLYARGHFDLSRELTRSNWTTDARQYIASDVTFGAGMSNIVTVPVAKIVLSAELSARLPTSLASRASTLQFGLEPTLRLSRSFEVLKGLQLGYSAAPYFAFHRYTTSELESPVIRSCAVGSVDCQRFLNAGDRNSPWGHTHIGSAGLQITPWFGLSGFGGVQIAHLYPAATDDRVNHVPQAPQSTRFTNLFGVGASFQPAQSIGIDVGALTFNPQLAPNSKFYPLAFNRFTQFYVDLRFQPGTLVSQLRGRAAGESK